MVYHMKNVCQNDSDCQVNSVIQVKIKIKMLPDGAANHHVEVPHLEGLSSLGTI